MFKMDGMLTALNDQSTSTTVYIHVYTDTSYKQIVRDIIIMLSRCYYK